MRRDQCISGPKPGEIIVGCGAYKKPPTNADRIRAMSDEELADYHAKLLLLGEYGVDPEKTEICKELWLNWLQSHAVGGDHDAVDWERRC